MTIPRKIRQAARLCALALSLFVLLAAPALALPAETATPMPLASPTPEPVDPEQGLFGRIMDAVVGEGIEGATSTVEIILLITVLSLAPSILIMVTAFPRIVIILSFTRNAIGTQQMPPNQVLIGLALFLTFFIMFPTFNAIVETAWEPYEAGEITDLREVADLTMIPLREFMINQIRYHNNQADLRLFFSLAGFEEVPLSYDEYPMRVLIPAFMTSEIKVAFKTGFFIFIPFIVIDMVVASVLMSMGMMMLPPIMISLPFKVMFFMLVDGWGMTIRGLILGSFG